MFEGCRFLLAALSFTLGVFVSLLYLHNVPVQAEYVEESVAVQPVRVHSVDHQYWTAV